MTIEQAIYFKVLICNGYPEELLKYIDTALETQDPLSDIVLEMSFAANDEEKLISLLNEHINSVKPEEIDFDGTLFDMLLAFFKRKYREENMPIDELVYLMYRFSLVYEPWDKWWNAATSRLWHVMYYMQDYYEFGDRNEFLKMLDDFLDNKIPPNSPFLR